MSDRMLYMAYGMNTNRDAMKVRCPAAEPLGGFYLPEHRVVFRGVADIIRDRDSVAPVVLWSITPACLRALDYLEGYPRLYTREQINGGWWIYKMNRKDRFAEPSAAYYRMIEEGYRDFGLDDWHLRAAAAEAA